MAQPMPPYPAGSFDAADITAWCRDVIGTGFGMISIAKKIEVQWNQRMRTAAGRAFWPSARIELNPRLQAVSLSEVERTVRHELAHIVAYARAGRRRIDPHGVEWQMACRELGIAGEAVCHRLPFEKRVIPPRYIYQCPSCQRNFPRVRPIVKKLACLDCCKRFNRGRYDSRFRLLLVPPVESRI